jgi:hypothetical protein
MSDILLFGLEWVTRTETADQSQPLRWVMMPVRLLEA